MVDFVKGAAALMLAVILGYGGSTLSAQAATLSFPASGSMTISESVAVPLLPETASRGLHNPVGALQPEGGSAFGQFATAGSMFLSALGSSPAMVVHGGLLAEEGKAAGAAGSFMQGVVKAFGYIVLSLYLLVALFAMARTLAECNETGSRSVTQRVVGCLLCLFWLPVALLLLVIEQVRGQEKMPPALRQSN